MPAVRRKRGNGAIYLRRVMEAEGFTVEPNEWWHFNYKDWRDYPILDVPFAAIRQSVVDPPPPGPAIITHAST